MKYLQLIQEAKEGNNEAMHEIFESFNKLIHLSARNFFIIGGDKEDVLQEARIGLLKAVNYYKFNKKASFKTFATLCIRRHLITAIKISNSKKNKVLSSSFSAHIQNVKKNCDYYDNSGKTADYYNPEEIYLEKEKYIALMEYVKTNLSAMEKELFEYILLEMTYTEIAEETGKKVKSVDNAIQRIKKKIKIFFQEYDNK